MTILNALVREINNEAAFTEKMLEKVPAGKFDWQPHEKSMTLKALATHTAHLSFWPEMVVNTEELDFADNNLETPKIETTRDLLNLLTAGTKASVTALQTADEKIIQESWTLRNGETILMEASKYNVIRQFSMNHLYHHRAQIGVYFRLLNIPVPGMYGPSADEKLEKR